ncbi:DUF58 domain-containing protein [Persicirhabdus sediminis]|nr:DUF58 domain-containing protein [Persicirhabdus sediminis]
MKYDFLDHEVLVRLGILPMESRQPMSGNVAGRHRSPHRGSSVEFAEYRKYVQGDDTRRLDWKAYARSDRYYIKEFEADTNMRGYFVLDSSGSMDFQGANDSRVQMARQLIAHLAYLLVDQGDAAGLSVCSDKINIEVPPSRRAAHLNHIFDTLAKTKPAGQTGLVDALHLLADKLPQRSMVFIMSDLFCDTEELADALQHLKFRKHDIAVFHLIDRAEIDFNFQRPHRFVDMEDKTTVVAEPVLIADEYKAAMTAFLQQVEIKCHDVAADYRLVTSDQSFEKVIHDFLEARIRRKGSH